MSDYLPEGWTQDKIDDMIEWQNKQKRKKSQEPEQTAPANETISTASTTKKGE